MVTGESPLTQDLHKSMKNEPSRIHRREGVEVLESFCVSPITIDSFEGKSQLE